MGRDGQDGQDGGMGGMGRTGGIDRMENGALASAIVHRSERRDISWRKARGAFRADVFV